MSQTNIIIAVLVAFVLIGGGYLLFQKPASEVTTTDKVQSTTESRATPGLSEKKMAFSEFMKQGGSYKCTVNQNIGGIDTVGTTYLHNGMIRGEYAATIQGMKVDTTLIMRDGFTYTWSSMAPTMGFKVKAVDTVSTGGDMKTLDAYSFDATQVGDYDCQAWAGNASAFELPKGVTFTDVK